VQNRLLKLYMALFYDTNLCKEGIIFKKDEANKFYAFDLLYLFSQFTFRLGLFDYSFLYFIILAFAFQSIEIRYTQKSKP